MCQHTNQKKNRAKEWNLWERLNFFFQNSFFQRQQFRSRIDRFGISLILEQNTNIFSIFGLNMDTKKWKKSENVKNETFQFTKQFKKSLSKKENPCDIFQTHLLSPIFRCSKMISFEHHRYPFQIKQNDEKLKPKLMTLENFATFLPIRKKINKKKKIILVFVHRWRFLFVWPDFFGESPCTPVSLCLYTRSIRKKSMPLERKLKKGTCFQRPFSQHNRNDVDSQHIAKWRPCSRIK